MNLKNFRDKIESFITSKSKFYSSKNGLLKNMFLLLIEIFDINLMNIIDLLSPIILKASSLLRNFIITLLKKLIRRSFLIKFLKKKFRDLADKQYEILLLYYGKNDVYIYIVGEEKAKVTDSDIPKSKKIIFTLFYIVDNFLNTTEQYIERFFLIFRQLFINAVFSIPNSIYYKIFPRNFSFSTVFKPKRFMIYVVRLIIISRFYTLIYGINLFYFYTFVFFKNLATSLYEARKTIFIGLIIFLILNLIFKESFFVTYEFFLSFFDYNSIVLNITEEAGFKNRMNDMFYKDTKYGYFFKSEYKQFYASGEFYKLYYVCLTLKTEFIKNIENYGRFFMAFPPGTVFAFHKYYFFKKKFYKHKTRKKKRYGESKRDRFARHRKEKIYRRKAVFERDFQKKSSNILKRVGKKYFGFFDDKIEGVYLYIGDVIQYFIRDRTHYFKVRRTTFYKKKLTSRSIFFKFMFRTLFYIFWILKKLIMIAIKKIIFKIFIILATLAIISYVVIDLGPKRKNNIKIVIKDYVLFDCTLEEFICNLILNSIIVIIFFYVISFIPPVLHFYIFKVYMPFLAYLYRKIKRYFNL